jgi:AcrR family transcriptional regulator
VARFSIPAKPQRRRSHAERTAETRARIIEAAIESIAEQGFQRTTANEIAKRAGVTWGAVQHHFGDKDGIVTAVLEDSFDRFAARLDDIPVDGTTVGERVDLFIERAWAHFGSPHYRSTFQILLSYVPTRHDAADGPTLQQQMFVAWDEVWTRIFTDSSLEPRQRYALEHYTISVLSGLASSLMLEGNDARLADGELDMLKETLVDHLDAHRGRGASARRPGRRAVGP